MGLFDIIKKKIEEIENEIKEGVGYIEKKLKSSFGSKPKPTPKPQPISKPQTIQNPFVVPTNPFTQEPLEQPKTISKPQPVNKPQTPKPVSKPKQISIPRHTHSSNTNTKKSTPKPPSKNTPTTTKSSSKPKPTPKTTKPPSKTPKSIPNEIQAAIHLSETVNKTVLEKRAKQGDILSQEALGVKKVEIPYVVDYTKNTVYIPTEYSKYLKDFQKDLSGSGFKVVAKDVPEHKTTKQKVKLYEVPKIVKQIKQTKQAQTQQNNDRFVIKTINSGDKKIWEMYDKSNNTIVQTVKTKYGNYEVVKDLKTGFTYYKIGNDVYTEEDLKKLARKPEFLATMVFNPENPMFARQIATFVGGLLKRNMKEARKHGSEIVKEEVLRLLLLRHLPPEKRKMAIKEGALGGLEMGLIGASAILGGAGGLVGTATNTAIAGTGAYGLYKTVPAAIKTKNPEAIGGATLSTIALIGGLVGAVKSLPKSPPEEVNLEPEGVFVDLLKGKRRVGEFHKIGRVKIKVKGGGTLDGELLEKEVVTPEGLKIKNRIIRIKPQKIKVNGKTIDVKDQIVGIKDYGVLKEKIYEAQSNFGKTEVVSERNIEHLLTITKGEKPSLAVSGRKTITKSTFFNNEELGKYIPSAKNSKISLATREGKELIRTKGLEEPTLEEQIQFKEIALKKGNKLVAIGKAKSVKNGVKTNRYYGLREREIKPGDLLKLRIEEVKNRIQTLKGRITKTKSNLKGSIKEEVEKPEDFMKVTEDILEKRRVTGGKTKLAEKPKVNTKNALEETFNDLKVAKDLLDVKYKGSIDTGNLGRILANYPDVLISRASVISATKQSRVNRIRKIKQKTITKPKTKQQEEFSIVQDFFTILGNMNLHKKKVKQKQAVAQKQTTKTSTRQEQILVDVDINIPKPPNVRIRKPKRSLPFLVLPSITENFRSKRLGMKPSQIKRKFVNPETLLSLEGPKLVLSQMTLKKKKSNKKKEINPINFLYIGNKL